jgi:hypothetical protein
LEGKNIGESRGCGFEKPEREPHIAEVQKTPLWKRGARGDIRINNFPKDTPLSLRMGVLLFF